MPAPPNPITRRRFLRGAGGVAIALPFLLYGEGSIKAQTAPARERLITVYFAQGIPAVLRNFGSAGALGALAPFQSKLTMVRGLTCNATSPSNGHSHGSAGFACGFGTDVVSTKGGPSLDWVVHEATATETPLPTLSMGISGGDDAEQSIRYNHSWRGINRPNLVILDTMQLFEAIFGAVPMAPAAAGADPVLALKARQRVSVLDAVVADYQHVVGDAAGYSPSIRSMISDHLDTIRELERRAVAVQLSLSGQGSAAMASACAAPSAPTRMHSYLGPPIGTVEPKTTPYFDAMWPVMVDLYVLAMRCDLVRFGNVMVTSGGDSYPYTSSAGHADNIHGGGYHLWLSTPTIQPLVTDHARWQMEKIAQFLTKLDDPTFNDVGGGSLLDNTTVVIGTELGDDVANHGLTDMPFWVAGARKRFKPGDFPIAGGRSDVDFYNTVLRSAGIDAAFGDSKYFQGILPLLA